MSQLDDVINDIEYLGFNRGDFPLCINGHTILLLHNDCYQKNDRETLIHITLLCKNCDRESHISGILPIFYNSRIPLLKLYLLAEFCNHNC